MEALPGARIFTENAANVNRTASGALQEGSGEAEERRQPARGSAVAPLLE